MAVSKVFAGNEVNLDHSAFEWEIRDIFPWHFNYGQELQSPTFYVGNNNMKFVACFFKNPRFLLIILKLQKITNTQGSKSKLILKCEFALVTASTKVPISYQRHYADGHSAWYHFDSAIFHGLCSTDSFIIKCEKEKPAPIPAKSTECPMPSHTFQLEKDFRQLIKGPHQFHDFTIVVRDKKYPVYKGILAARSAYFAKMFNHDLAENRENTMTIDDTEPEAIEAMLEYIYTGQVMNLDQVAGDLIEVAHRYQLSPLQVMCEKALQKVLDTENACEMMIIASKIGSPEFLQFVKTFINNHFREVIEFGSRNIDDPKRFQDAIRLITNKDI